MTGLDECDMLRMLGWTVAEVDDLRDHGCLVTGGHVALIRAGLRPCERDETLVRLLSMALSHEAGAPQGL